MTGGILQNGAFDVDFVHEIQSVARSLKLVVKPCCILLPHELLKLAHAGILCGLRRAAKEPRLLLEDWEILHLEIAGLLWLAFYIHRVLQFWRKASNARLNTNNLGLRSKLHW